MAPNPIVAISDYPDEGQITLGHHINTITVPKDGVLTHIEAYKLQDGDIYTIEGIKHDFEAHQVMFLSYSDLGRLIRKEYFSEPIPHADMRLIQELH